jgi:hypothetical protein
MPSAASPPFQILSKEDAPAGAPRSRFVLRGVVEGGGVALQGGGRSYFGGWANSLNLRDGFAGYQGA